jgi:transporter family-2 protein
MSKAERTKRVMNGLIPPVVLIIAVGLIGGIAVGIQSPLASLMSQRLGTLESVFLVHIGGAIAALVPLLVLGGGRLGEWRSLPWYALTAGLFGVIVVSAISYTIPRVGIAAAITTVVAGQLLTSSLLDHFGLLGAAARPLDLPRLAGLGVVMLGVWLTVR